MRYSFLSLLTIVGLAPAQTYTWNVANGSFQSASSWTPAGGPPGVTLGVTAAFTGPSPLTQYLATMDSDWAVNSLTVNQGTTTLALNGHPFPVQNRRFHQHNPSRWHVQRS